MKRSLVPRNPILSAIVRLVVNYAITALPSIIRALTLQFQQVMRNEGGGVPSISGRRMGVEEAHKILEVKPGASAEELKKRSERLASINSPQGDFPGSPYLQSKVETAFKVLSEKSEKENDKETKSKGGGS
uniref:Mitochondrial import inner membrane translocase subunit TIM16 n=1 Tax=Chromera velia CCMP2878 TaxID=1169474 RepID=A0A0G4HN77_9ALVE|eukprot:Cvel_7593.t1-p1 / transcript=Cvel_7593.t1 / gene=Cvel_7593 / organism=Chromera_velia_CCMP2878 / gene_product=hypothetical protein / transcript_product=hypothetical protein / location=Cvel_scaffold400:18049-20441(+) / protein_length=130 / sequence_SO=supercontig / SO=protein_coding / is_pseudo=false